MPLLYRHQIFVKNSTLYQVLLTRELTLCSFRVVPIFDSGTSYDPDPMGHGSSAPPCVLSVSDRSTRLFVMDACVVLHGPVLANWLVGACTWRVAIGVKTPELYDGDQA